MRKGTPAPILTASGCESHPRLPATFLREGGVIASPRPVVEEQMAEKPTPTPQERGILELMSTGAYITADPDGPGPRVRLEGGVKNAPQISMSMVERLRDAEWIEEVWDDDEEMTRPRYTLSTEGRQFLEENPDAASEIPREPLDPKETGAA